MLPVAKLIIDELRRQGVPDEMWDDATNDGFFFIGDRGEEVIDGKPTKTFTPRLTLMPTIVGGMKAWSVGGCGSDIQELFYSLTNAVSHVREMMNFAK